MIWCMTGQYAMQLNQFNRDRNPDIYNLVQIFYLPINIKCWLAWQVMAYVCYTKLNETGVLLLSSPQVP